MHVHKIAFFSSFTVCVFPVARCVCYFLFWLVLRDLFALLVDVVTTLI